MEQKVLVIFGCVVFLFMLPILLLPFWIALKNASPQKFMILGLNIAIFASFITGLFGAIFFIIGYIICLKWSLSQEKEGKDGEAVNAESSD